MLKSSLFVPALSIIALAGMFAVHAMPVEKEKQLAQGVETATPAAPEAQSGKKLKLQAICPVMGETIDKKVYADHAGKRVYFCCPGCIEPFKKNPEKYLKKMKKAGEEPEMVKE